ncbi:MAG: site-specific integrase [Alphaproteobacteria bacterium]|nr:site-specific integrase [Alphaproteobacteria bacterium]
MAEKDFPTIEQICAVLKKMPLTNEVERRNQALIAFTLLTGVRVQVLMTLKIKHVYFIRGLVRQNPKEVKTKFSKTINTFFFPVRENVRQIVVDWIDYLIKGELYDLNSPLFPRTALKHDKNNAFVIDGLEPIHWTTTTPIREIFKEAFKSAGLPYYNPHSFRNTRAELGQKVCTNPEQFKAWSQNLGHESPLTTFTSYGTLSLHRQGEVMERLGINRG